MTALMDGRTETPPTTTLPATTWVKRGAVVPRPVTRTTLEDRIMQVGSFVAAACGSWLLYFQLLPFSGLVGFVLFTFALYLGLCGLVTVATRPWTEVADRLVAATVTGGALIVLAAVVWTVVYIVVRGWPAVRHLNFFSQDMSTTGPLNPLTQGGISHALVGTAIELAIAVAASLPLGLATGVYLSDVGGRFARLVRTVVEAMTALPDLIAGLFIYAFLIVGLGMQRDGLAAALALAITMLPIIARSSEVTLRVVPGGLREASLALGATQWRTLWSVVLPTARSGLASALILGMARGVGESAPLLIVTRSSGFFNTNPINNPMNSLALYAVTDIRAPDANTITRGFGAATVLLLFVTVLFIAVRLLARERAGSR